DLPHQPDEGLAPFRMEMALEHAGEGIEIDGLAVRLLAGQRQIVQFGAGHTIVLAEHRLEALPLRILSHTIDIHDVVEKRGGGHARIVIPGPAAGVARNLLQEGKKTLEHQNSLNLVASGSGSSSGSTPGSSGRR